LIQKLIVQIEQLFNQLFKLNNHFLKPFIKELLAKLHKK